MFNGPCGRPGLYSGLMCSSAHNPIYQKRLRIHTVPVHRLEIGHDQSFLSVSPGLWRKGWFWQEDAFGKPGTAQWPCVCQDNVCGTSEQIVKMAASFKFCLISNLHDTVRLTADTSFTREGNALLSNRWNHSVVVLIIFFHRGQIVWLIQYVPQIKERINQKVLPVCDLSDGTDQKV